MKDPQISLSKIFSLIYAIIIGFLFRHWFTLLSCLLIIQLFSNSELRHVEVRVEAGNGTNTFAVGKKIDGSDSQLNLETPEKALSASDFGNLSFILNPNLAESKNVDQAIVSSKLRVCTNYIHRYLEIALNQMEDYNIPASIILSQALLESNAGESKLAKDSKNHFGIKCRKKCRGCTCRNYSDDDIYDMFRVFETDLESFKEHSKLLQISRYSHLLKLDRRDYKNWAIGLKKAGYATDRNYHLKLIRIIEGLKLYEYDQWKS